MNIFWSRVRLEVEYFLYHETRRLIISLLHCNLVSLSFYIILAKSYIALHEKLYITLCETYIARLAKLYLPGVPAGFR